MTKSSTPKVAAKKARGARRKSATKVAAEKARGARRKGATKVAAEKARGARRKGATKTAAENAPDTYRKTSPKVAIGEARDIQRKVAAQFEEFRDSRVPATMQALAQGSVAQTREVYERSKNALQAVLESWQKSFGAAGQGAVALNRKIIDVAERNINNGFDLATGLAGAKNVAEVMELQAAYWRKQFSELRTQAAEVRGLSTKVATEVARPIKAQLDAGVPRRNQ